MDHNSENIVPLFKHSGKDNGTGGGGDGMDGIIKKVEQLEKDTHQIKVDMATLTERSQNFASKSALEALIERSAHFATKADLEILRTENALTRADLVKEISASESRLNTKIDSINNRIIWTLLVPALTAIILWFLKVAVLKV
ncbi:hypothetical protein [Pantoea sp. BAV 3049]|uniref:hypothetical protein n=1 Tax=Pantoea sp. BAV 3049 TaxID=2654188 RepID=UPI00131CB012|nr:hypothetical protein [Pantoea sp. BAV 3049]